MTEPLFLAVPAGHRLAGQQEVHLAEVADEDFVMLRQTWALRVLSDELCAAAGFVPRVAFEGDDLPVIRGFVAAGLGVAIVPAAGSALPSASPRSEPLLRILDERRTSTGRTGLVRGTSPAAIGRTVPPARARPKPLSRRASGRARRAGASWPCRLTAWPRGVRGLVDGAGGAHVLLDRADGSTVGFRVMRVEVHKQTRFPKVRVYWPTLQREPRLITCGGQYVGSRGGYQSNVVVFATAEPTGGPDR